MSPLALYQDYSRKDVHDIFEPYTEFQPQRGSWGIWGIVKIPQRPGDYVFFVTFGQSQGEHVFDESITEDGVLSWQSQPSQHFEEPRIQEFLHHDETVNSIYLFLRTQGSRKYTYLGKLKYLSHDAERERPVWFQWQILDWNPPAKVLQRMGLDLEPLTSGDINDETIEQNILQQIVVPQFAKTRGITTAEFRAVKKIDSSASDARNKDLGLQGEKLVLQYEIEHLLAIGKPELAERVQHTSVVEGDGAGYDILSYTPEGKQKYIEVKTTTGDERIPFYLTRNEVAFSELHAEEFCLYRVFEYSRTKSSGRFYVLHGSLNDTAELTPIQFRAHPLACSDDK